MKKVILLFLLFCLVSSVFACGKNDKKDADPSVTEGSPEAEAQPDFSAFSTYMTYGYDKIIANKAPKAEESTSFTVYLAKGESEGCQIVIYNSAEMTDLVLKIESGENAYVENKIYTTERTHKIGGKEYTDSLIPYYSKKLSVEGNTALTFMLEFTTFDVTPAGEYEYVYKLYDLRGDVVSTYNVTLHVWDYMIPEERTFESAFGIASSYIPRYGQPYRFYYDALLEHGLCAYDLPYSITSDEADAYMSDPRVTAFRVPCDTDEVIMQCYEKLRTNPVWLEKAYFYPYDEPYNLEMLEEYRRLCIKLKEMCPEIPIVAPYYTNIKVGDGKDQTDHMAESGTVLWCPKLNLWDDENSYAELDYTPEKSFAERMTDVQNGGGRVWSYVCNDPDDPYAQLFIDTVGVNQRAMFWQMYQRDIEGFLYWSTTAWGSGGAVIDPWKTTANGVKNGEGQTIYGEGFLFYPGNPVGVPEPVGSIRLKICRDGIEDIEMLYLAEELFGKDWVISKTLEVSDSLVTFCDNDVFDAVRIEIGNALEAAADK